MAKKERFTKEMGAKIIARAWKDEKFRKQLIDNPKKTLRDFGIEIPSNVEFKVKCDDSTHYHFIIPPPPSNQRELNERELEKLAAAFHPMTARKPGPLGPGGSAAPPVKLKIKLTFNILFSQ